MAMERHEAQLHRLPPDSDIIFIRQRTIESSSTSSISNSDTSFIINMVIVLAALLCALIFALGLNYIVRCGMRCRNRFNFLDPEGTAMPLSSSIGVRKKKLSQLPMVVYQSGGKIPATDCPICLREFMEGEKVRILPGCDHGFHVKCIDTWLLSNSSCPTCRQLLFGQQHTSSSTAEEVNS